SPSRTDGETSLSLSVGCSSSRRVCARNVQLVCPGRQREGTKIHQTRAISAGLDFAEGVTRELGACSDHVPAGYVHEPLLPGPSSIVPGKLKSGRSRMASLAAAIASSHS